ncbi:hypothetical protein AGABI2DRAFT_177999 [Agaricus bisporus var. bisporus H97]|uniref:hypothetical protein n=1 Tax=Agaricus bisporus var. bisporus (strain H97 / ATCC MYA-4626 / FGSC 10389) TaxID=936046 RepID=UPI00029F4FE9|nr:hypothetical protein AGABI2DRAFT_177999 [Agaricus bisporus var. bisporus H97]EKV48575.1 hypothetical protein AGABI2DRAFT_177999 [Agaricus bisporus var. bisporus H97]
MNNDSSSSTTKGRTTSHNNPVQGCPTTKSLKNKFAKNVSRSSAALVAILNRGFSGECKFPILTRTIDRQSSPELMKTKETVKGIPKIEFQTLSEFSQQILDNGSRLQKHRREIFLNRAFVSNEPRLKQIEEVEGIRSWITEEQNNFGTSGAHLIGRHSHTWVSNEADKVDSKICAIQILRENTEYWQGFWAAIKDQLVPNISLEGPKAFVPLLGLVNWAAELIASSVVYDKSWEREKFLEVLDTWEDMLRKDHKLILQTQNELANYIDSMSKAKTLWATEVAFVWGNKVESSNISGDAIIQYESCLRNMESAERMLSLTIQPISVQRDTNDFCDHVPYITIDLKKLLTAKDIISDSQAELFEEKVYDLARIIYGRLEAINELCAQWSKPIDPGELASFLREGTKDFLIGTNQVITAIKTIVQNETCDSKKKQAAKKRMEWDRRYKNWNWKDRPLVSTVAVNEVLEDLEVIIGVIHCLSVSTATGTNMRLSIGKAAEVKRSQVEFSHSNSLLNDFFDVLGNEIQRGSMVFSAQRVKEQTKTKKSHGGLFRRQWNKWWGAKPAAPIEELGLI